MPSDSRTQTNGHHGSLSRRSILRVAGATGLTGLAGCTNSSGSQGGNSSGQGNNSSGNGGNGSSDIVPHIGIEVPLSGSFSPTGKNMRDSIKLAAKDTIDAGVVADVKTDVKDTKTDPSTAQKNTRQQIDNGADFIMGFVADSVGLAAANVTNREKILQFCQGGHDNFKSVINNCFPYLYATGWSIPGYTQGGLGYAVRNDQGDLGEKVYFISSDFTWPQSMEQYAKNYIFKQDDVTAKAVGTSKPPFGETSFSSYIAKAKNSDADIVALHAYGSDFVHLVNQAYQHGLMDEKVCVGSVMAQSFADGIGKGPFNSDNFYFGLNWVPFKKNKAAQSFESKWKKNFDTPEPTLEGTTFYAVTRTLLKACADVGSTETDKVQKAINGRSWEPSIWPNKVSYRACDGFNTAPVLTAQGIQNDGTWTEENVVNIDQTADHINFPCEEVACSSKEN